MTKVILTVAKKPDNSENAEKENKLGGQALKIVETIVSKVGVGKPIDRADLCKELESSGVLNTKQAVERVVGYYQPRLEEKGFLTVEKEAAEPKEKPAKAEKAAPQKAGVKATAKSEAGA